MGMLKHIDENGEAKPIDEISYCLILDPEMLDFRMFEIMFIDNFKGPSVIVKVDGQSVRLPADYRIILYDADVAKLDSVRLGEWRDCFGAFSFNALADRMCESVGIEVVVDDVRNFAHPRCAGYVAMRMGEKTLYVGRGEMSEIDLTDLL
ncbi:hypothetical protein [Novosphingobium sp. EMRT-2]|uniref:hypothetical protein n=1 Tax=Novosphingobium sp. EMRT-2 TaxID=2571749 RepID=UPI0010BD074C|nr:hypothetical protein [Novosphingobium sp. EMRT-2]QCI92586.1 hypothetical protein FA702_02795 [Novosphingobium sp. EMRT-2]